MRHNPPVGLILSALIVALAPCGAPAQVPAPRALAEGRAQAVDAAVRAEMDRQRVVGLALGVVRGGEVVYVNGFGLADRESNVPVTNNTLFRWASCSKPVTAVAAMQLVEAGSLTLDADVRSLVPEFPDHNATVTVRHLLCHQGGIVHYTNGKVVRTERNYESPHPFANVITALDTFKESPLVCRPGEKYSYSTHGYILLSAVVQRAGRQPFADQVRDRITRPLGLRTLRPDYQWEALPGRAVGYRRKEEAIDRSTDTDVSWKLGGGGYISDVEDFTRFAAALVNHRLVSEKTAARMWERQKLTDGTVTDYGLGFGVAVGSEGRLTISHSGSQEKTRTRFVIHPKERTGVVVMTNSEWADPKPFVTVVEEALGGD